MRLGEWMRAASSSVPWMLLALSANPAAAQFREVHPGADADAAVEIRLTPTQEHFVAPRVETSLQSWNRFRPECRRRRSPSGPVRRRLPSRRRW